MVCHPPAAEAELKNKQQDSCQEAGCDAQIIVQSESPVIEQQGTEDTLSNVVGQTHASVRDNLCETPLQAGAIVGEKYSRHQQKHEGKLI